MTEKQTQNLSLKQRLRAIQNLEDTLGNPRINLNQDERYARSMIIRKLLGLENPLNLPDSTFDIAKFAEIMSKFFNKMGIDQAFNRIEIRVLPKDMFIKFEGNILVLEKAFIQSRSAELVIIIAIHETYHKYGQNLNPDMIQVKCFTDFFDQQTIIEMDIDADVETFEFLVENAGLDFNQYLELIYDSTKKGVSENPTYATPRIPKIVRSIGSLLSIYTSQKSKSKNILVPNLHEIDGESNYVACISNGRKFAKVPSIKKLVNLFLSLTDLSKEDFINTTCEYCEEIYTALSSQLKLETNLII